MAKNIARFLITLVGLFVGPGIFILVFEILRHLGGGTGYTVSPLLNLAIFVSSGIASGVIFLFLSKPIVGLIFKSAGRAERKIARLPSGVIMPAVIGLILGLIVAYLLRISWTASSCWNGWQGSSTWSSISYARIWDIHLCAAQAGFFRPF
jgi:uncharacterized protein YacL